MTETIIEIIQPDDWHVHLREDKLLEVVSKYSFRINNRCIVMPNLENPIINSELANKYKEQIKKTINNNTFIPLIPCYLTENLDLTDFKYALENEIFIGAKLYPSNVTTNSDLGVSNIEKIYPALEILEQTNKNLLIHGEKLGDNIDFFDREKYFIDDELTNIRKRFSSLKIVLEHVSSKYGADYIAQNENIAGTITPQHMLITREDVFLKDKINPHNFCMPVVKEQEDLKALRKYACSGNKKFFLGTDSAPHEVKYKSADLSAKPGIFSSPCSIELYAKIFDEESSINNLEKFSSINGPNFYNLPINENKIKIAKKKWILDEYTDEMGIKIKNFFGGKELNWKVLK